MGASTSPCFRYILFRINIALFREGTYVFSCGDEGGGVRAGVQRGGLSVKVSTTEGGPYPLFQLFKGRVTHLFQNVFL